MVYVWARRNEHVRRLSVAAAVSAYIENGLRLGAAERARAPFKYVCTYVYVHDGLRLGAAERARAQQQQYMHIYTNMIVYVWARWNEHVRIFSVYTYVYISWSTCGHGGKRTCTKERLPLALPLPLLYRTCMQQVRMRFLCHSRCHMHVLCAYIYMEQVRMSFLGLFQFSAPYLPWVLLGFSLLLGALHPYPYPNPNPN